MQTKIKYSMRTAYSNPLHFMYPKYVCIMQNGAKLLIMRRPQDKK